MPSSQSIPDEQRWPHKKMKSGDRVKLSQRGIKACRKSRGGPSIPLDRRGTVHYANNYSASVLWDGRSSLDKIPIEAIELEPTAGENFSTARFNHHGDPGVVAG